MKKIAVCLRGQTRNSILGAELFDRLFVKKLHNVDIRVYIHTWHTTSTSSAGMLSSANIKKLNTADVVKLNDPWNYSALAIDDDDRYTAHIKNLLNIDGDQLQQYAWKTAQIYSAYESFKLLKKSEWKPDIVMSTRHDTFYNIIDSTLPILDNSGVYTNWILNDNNLTHVKDDCFFMSYNQFVDLDLDSFDRRLKNVQQRFTMDHINSHHLYPLLLFYGVNFKLIESIEYSRLHNLDNADNLSYYEIGDAIDRL